MGQEWWGYTGAPNKVCLCPRTCECDLIRKQDLCSCNEGKDLEIRSCWIIWCVLSLLIVMCPLKRHRKKRRRPHKEGRGHKPRIPGAARRWKRQDGVSSGAFEGRTAPWTPWFQTSGFPNCETTSICCFKSRCLWQFFYGNPLKLIQGRLPEWVTLSINKWKEADQQ